MAPSTFISSSLRRSSTLLTPPLIFASGSELGDAITTYLSRSAISVLPTPAIEQESFDVVRVKAPASAVMTPGTPMEWRWRIKEKLFAPQRAAKGHIDILLQSPTVRQDVQPGLPFDVAGYSWWWPAEWVFDHIIKNWKESVLAIVFFQILWTGGRKRAWPWLLNKAGADEKREDNLDV